MMTTASTIANEIFFTMQRWEARERGERFAGGPQKVPPFLPQRKKERKEEEEVKNRRDDLCDFAPNSIITNTAISHSL
jgi:hypothetical protein